MVADNGWAGKLAVAGVVARWQAIVGDQIAEHCTIESFEAGRITLRASSSSWAQQLRLLQPTIEARIIEALRSGPGGRQAGASVPVMAWSCGSWDRPARPGNVGASACEEPADHAIHTDSGTIPSAPVAGRRRRKDLGGTRDTARFGDLHVTEVTTGTLSATLSTAG